MNESNRIREHELATDVRLDNLEARNLNGAIHRNAEAMKETIEQWNKMYVELDTRISAMENNIVSLLQVVKSIQDNNTLALQRIIGTGPTA